MLYGTEKVRHMARSILPSARRKSAREDLAYVKRRARADMRRRLRTLRYDDYDDRVDDFNFYPQSHAPNGTYEGSIKGVVYERRQADKLAHFERWAIKRTAHIDEPDARLAKMRAMLPAGLIGDHAVSHLVNYDEFDVDPTSGFYLRALLTNDERKAEREAKREERLEGLRSIVRDHRLKKLNWALKRAHFAGPHRRGWNPNNYEYYRCEFCTGPRLLLGLHDVVAFEALVFGRETFQHREWKDTAERYLENDFG